MRNLPIVLACTVILGAAADALSQETDDSVRIFSIPVTRDAHQLADEATDHLQSERWQEGLFTLQELLANHAGDLLPESYVGVDSTGRPVSDVHPGASAWAARKLRSIPAEARRLYRARYGPGATEALRAARAGGTRRDLMRVAQTWPITTAARQAWWTLGDLEFELGHLSDAERCWRRAADLTELDGEELSAGAQRRFEFARDLMRADAEFGTGDGNSAQSPSARAGALGSLYLAGPGEGGGPGPLSDSDEPWVFQLDATGPFSEHGENYNLYPVLAGERVVVSDSMKVYVVDAFGGTLVWKSEESPEWATLSSRARQEFFQAIESQNNLIAPAVGDGVVVAALQIPLANLRNSEFQGITITRTIPERRLFAFDLQTGERLWDHRPSEDTEFGGSFAERMKVAGPPVIVGSRVIVPSYQLQGRINYQLACYELFTGEPLWTSALISGQRELNMFGRHEVEFCAPPVRVTDDRVIALTQLGAIAAVDLFTGRILWESLYEPISLPKSQGWRLMPRTQIWRNTAPLVAGNAVIATPSDSEFVYGFHLDTGAQLWSSRYERLSPRGGYRAQPNVLLGADRGRLYFGGGAISAWSRAGGLDVAGGAFQQVWSDALPEGSNGDYLATPRPLLGRGEIIVPTFDERITLSRNGQRPDAPAAWDYAHVGNLVLGNGMLFSVNGRRLAGFFDWGILLERTRQRLARSPRDRSKTIVLADLLERRGRALFDDGKSARAEDYVDEARTLLEDIWSLQGDVRDPRVSRSLHRVYLSEARLLATRADTDRALERIDRALPLDNDPRARRDALLLKETLVRMGPEWTVTLDGLVGLGDGLSMPIESLRPDRAALPARDPWANASISELEDFKDVPVQMWALVQRAGAHASRSQFRAELSDLHTLLERYPGVSLPGNRTIGDYAHERIASRLESNGRSIYATFEDRAQELIRNPDPNNPTPLEIAIELFPHSLAASEARDTLLTWALEEGNIDEASRRVNEGLSSEPTPTREDAELLLRLAGAYDREGSHRLAAGIRADLAREHPNLVPQDLRAPRTPESAALLPADRSTFDADLTASFANLGVHAVLGEVPPRFDARGDELPARLVVAAEDALFAYDPDHASDPVWTYQSRNRLLDSRTNLQRFALSPERVIFVRGRGVYAVDVEDGRGAWSWMVSPRNADSVIESDGVTLILTTSAKAPQRLHALDTLEGVPLWELELPPECRGQTPRVEDGKIVMLGVRGAEHATALVIDLFRGTVVRRLSLGIRLPPSGQGTFLHENLLIVPAYNASRTTRSRRNDIRAFDLETGELAWTHEFAPWQDLTSIARVDKDVYLILRANDVGDPSHLGAIHELNPRSGADRMVVQLERDDHPMGFERGRVTDLPSPMLFVCNDVSGSEDTLLTAIQLPMGKLWSFRLPVSHLRLYVGTLPQPAVSTSTVAVAYATRDLNDRRQDGIQLQFLDRRSGTPRDRRRLSPELGRATSLDLTAFGNGLFLSGRRQRDGHFQIWEVPR